MTTEYTEKKQFNVFLRVLRGEKILAAFARICGLLVRITRISKQEPLSKDDATAPRPVGLPQGK